MITKIIEYVRSIWREYFLDQYIYCTDCKKLLSRYKIYSWRINCRTFHFCETCHDSLSISDSYRITKGIGRENYYKKETK